MDDYRYNFMTHIKMCIQNQKKVLHSNHSLVGAKLLYCLLAFSSYFDLFIIVMALKHISDESSSVIITLHTLVLWMGVQLFRSG